ncbi:MAG: sigma-70 family RNA polymerase sigma factor [Actinomycetes bacterium]
MTDSKRGGDPTADERVREHLPLVGYIVNEVAGRLPGHVAREDLIGAGMAGLAQAALSYDPSTGVPFNRYASLRVRGAILDELRSMDWATRGTRSRGRAVVAAEEALTDRLGRTPTTAELAAEMGVGVAELDRRRAESERALLSLDAFETPIADSLPTAGPDPEEQLVHSERIGYLRAAVKTLPDRLRTVAVGVYFEQRPMTEIAAELGVTESRVSQLRAEALTMLRDAMNSQFDPQLLPEQRRPDGAVARRRSAYYAQVAQQASLSGLLTRMPAAAVPAAPVAGGGPLAASRTA